MELFLFHMDVYNYFRDLIPVFNQWFQVLRMFVLDISCCDVYACVQSCIDRALQRMLQTQPGTTLYEAPADVL